MNISEYIPAFINFYYTTILKNPNDLYKFYHPNATYYRPNRKSPEAIKVESDKVCPRIPKRSILTISSYSFSNLDKDVSLNISGNWEANGNITVFSQFFILREVAGRICIMQDFLNEIRQSAFQPIHEHKGQRIEIIADSESGQNNTANAKSAEPQDESAEMYECERPEPKEQPPKNRNQRKKNQNRFVFTPGKD